MTNEYGQNPGEEFPEGSYIPKYDPQNPMERLIQKRPFIVEDIRRINQERRERLFGTNPSDDYK